jgi:hypothetical protein
MDEVLDAKRRLQTAVMRACRAELRAFEKERGFRMDRVSTELGTRDPESLNLRIEIVARRGKQ